MKILLDTNRLIDLLRGVKAVQEHLEYADQVFVPYIVLAELRAGFLLSSRAHEKEQRLQQFLNAPGVDPLFADNPTTHHYARLYAQLKKQGTPIGLNDIWIASLALQHDLLLYTRDKDFDRLPQVPRLERYP